MKIRDCCYEKCGERRVHHERQDEPRGTMQIEVEDDYPDDKPVFCSYTCGLMAGAFSLRFEGK